MIDLVVVIPAYNEEREIKTVISKVREFAHPIIVDDGSKDQTAYFSRQLGATVLSHTENKGYEKALETGFQYFLNSNFEYVITMDADNQHKPGCIVKFYEELSRGADCVVGIRNKKQRIGETVFSLISKKVWGIDDPLCGMKAYSRSCFNVPLKNSYDSVGTKYALHSAMQGLNISQVDIRVEDRKDNPRFGSGLKPNFKILCALLKGLLVFKITCDFKNQAK